MEEQKKETGFISPPRPWPDPPDDLVKKHVKPQATRPIEREAVYRRVDGEIEYAKHWDKDRPEGSLPDVKKPVESWLLYMDVTLAMAKKAACRGYDKTEALNYIQQIAGLAVNCLVNRGAYTLFEEAISEIRDRVKLRQQLYAAITKRDTLKAELEKIRTAVHRPPTEAEKQEIEARDYTLQVLVELRGMIAQARKSDLGALSTIREKAARSNAYNKCLGYIDGTTARLGLEIDLSKKHVTVSDSGSRVDSTSYQIPDDVQTTYTNENEA